MGIAIALRDAWIFEQADENSGRADQILSGWAVWCDVSETQSTKLSEQDVMDWQKSRFQIIFLGYMN